jgi:hypothetical protein
MPRECETVFAVGRHCEEANDRARNTLGRRPRARGDDVVKLFAGGTQNIIGEVRTIGGLA